MSIVPFIKDKTIVDTSTKFKLYEDKVLILNFDEEQFNDPRGANTSYDLRVGSVYWAHNEKNSTGLVDGQDIPVPPGASVIIQTEESVHFPASRFGQIVPKVTLLQRGISNTTSKVDPGYNGNLLITIFNLGKKTIRLKCKQEFCTLIIQDVMKEHILDTKVYDKAQKYIGSRVKTDRRRAVRDWIVSHKDVIALGISILAMIGVIYNAFFK